MGFLGSAVDWVSDEASSAVNEAEDVGSAAVSEAEDLGHDAYELGSETLSAAETGAVAAEGGVTGGIESMPLVGTVTNTLEAGYDTGKAMFYDHPGGATEDVDMGAAEMHLLQAIPLVGTGLGVYHGATDAMNGAGATEKQLGLTQHTDQEAEQIDAQKEADRQRIRGLDQRQAEYDRAHGSDS